MMSKFYKSIIEDEIKFFGIKQDSLKVAAKSVKQTYGQDALQNGRTFLDYNIPPNRCAYLYKFAVIHTYLVSSFFSFVLKNEQIHSILNEKGNIKICCLGGGPGTDIVGLFQAMALNPYYHKKVIQVTVLDICGGWRNSFNRIIANITKGKIESIPATFIDESNFKYKLIEVNLLNNLPANVVSVLSEADIVCMVKFVSAILGSSSSVPAIQNIGSKLKEDAIVLFIDNFQGNVFKPLTDMAEYIGLQIVSEPLHKYFKAPGYKKKKKISSAEMQLFGCPPLSGTRVTALVFLKSVRFCISDVQHTFVHETCHIPSKVKTYNLDTINDTRDAAPTQIPQSLTKIFCDKLTQTNISYIQDFHLGPETGSQLCLLIDSLSDLINVLNLWQEKDKNLKNCNHSHC